MKRLKELRDKKGLYQKDIALFLGIDRTTYVKYENGSSEPPNEVLFKLADYFHVSIDYLMGHEPPQTDSAPETDEVWLLRERLRRDPERRTLFDAAANVRKEDILTAVKILDALKGGEDSDDL